MEACLAVEKEIDKVLSKFGGINDHGKRVLSDLIDQVQRLKEEYESTDGEHALTNIQLDILKQTMGKIKETVSKMATDHRDLHSTVSKVGKAIDRNFVADFSATSREDTFHSAEKLQLMNQVICQHFCRQGMHDVAEELAKECDIVSESHEKEPLNEINHILDRLKVKDLEPALAWAVVHRESLEGQNSTLEFKLHRLRFIELLKNGPAFQTEAISYARTHFRKYVHRHEKGEDYIQ